MGGISREIRQRTGDVCLAERVHPPISGVEFELFIVRKAKKEHTWPGGSKTLVGDESVPPASAWGVEGWTFNDRPTALRRFEQLSQNQTIETNN